MLLKNTFNTNFFTLWLCITISFTFLQSLEAQIDSLQTVQYYIDTGNTYNKNYQFEDAITNYLTAVNILEKRKDSSQLTTVYTNIGVVNAKLKNFDKAIEYLTKSLNYVGNNESLKLRTLYNISAFYSDNKDIETSILKSKEAEIIAKKLIASTSPTYPTHDKPNTTAKL